MPTYIGGAVLASATVLPATGLLAYFRSVHPAVLVGLLAVALVSSAYYLYNIARYVVNLKKS